MFFHFVLLLPSMVCIFGAALLGTNYKTNSKSQNILAILALCAWCSMYIQANYISGISDFVMFYRLDIVDAFLSLLLFPLTYRYLVALDGNIKPSRWQYLWYLPSLFIGCSAAILYYCMGSTDAALFQQSVIEKCVYNNISTAHLHSIMHIICVVSYNWALIIQLAAITVFLATTYRRNRRKMQHESNHVARSILRRKYEIHQRVAACLVFAVLFVCLGRSYMLEHHTVAMIVFSLWAVPCFCWIRCAFQTVPKLGLIPTIDGTASTSSADICVECYRDSGDDGRYEYKLHGDIYELSELRTKLEALMSEQQLYLNPSLRIEDIATALFSNRTYISKMIRSEYGCNFTDYINSLRIEFAKEYIVRNRNMTHEYIARNCGFMSCSSFYRAFKKCAGVTPKNWLSQHCSA